MLNKVILKGNLGRDPQIWVTQKGQEIATFSLATHTSWKDKEGEWQTSTDWHKITVFKESTIRWLKDILKQGVTVYVEGKLRYQRQIKYHQIRLTPHIVVTNQEGRVEYLRSPVKVPQGEDIVPVDSLEEIPFLDEEPEPFTQKNDLTQHPQQKEINHDD